MRPGRPGAELEEEGLARLEAVGPPLREDAAEAQRDELIEGRRRVGREVEGAVENPFAAAGDFGH